MTTQNTPPSTADQATSDEPPESPKLTAKLLVDQLFTEGTLFRDQYDRANYVPGGSACARPIVVQEGAFADWLSAYVYSAFQTTLKKNIAGEVTSTLVGLSQQCDTRSVFVRTTRAGGTVYIDMATPAGSVIAVNADGWHLTTLSEVPVLFRRAPGMKPLPTPSDEGSFDILERWWNPEDPQGVAFIVIYLAYCLAGIKNFPILVLQGAAGSGKTEAACLMRDLVDPNEVPTLAGFGNPRDNIITFLNSRLVVMDNARRFKAQESDRACRLTTGDGMRVRALYTNADEQLFRVCAPLIITSIHSPLAFDDMADRTFTLHFNRIPGDKRQTHGALRRQFEQHAPQLLGGLLDVVKGALSRQQQAPDALPRMADFGTFGHAAAPEVNLSTDDFADLLQRLRGNGEDGEDEDNAPVFITVLQRFMGEAAEPWQGRATDLLGELNNAASNVERGASDWPQTPSQLGRKLRDFASTLESHGLYTKHFVSGGRKLEVRFVSRHHTPGTIPPTPVSPATQAEPAPDETPRTGSTDAASANADVYDIRAFRRHG